MHRRFGVSGVELGEDHHTLPLLRFIALAADVRPTVTRGLER
jgi:hypothetical protein